MKLFLLIAIISTTEDHKRGYGDGIAASKSASAAIHMERFSTIEMCNLAKKGFMSFRMKGGGASAKCVNLKELKKESSIEGNIHRRKK